MALKKWSEMMQDAETDVSGYQPLEDGEYSFVIEKAATVGETQKGYPKFTIRATVESGPRKNAVHTHHFNASESSYAMKNFFFKPLYAIGIAPSFLATDPSNEQIAEAFQGKRFSARIQPQRDNAEYKEMVDFAPASGAAPVSNAGVPQGLTPQPTPQAAPAPAPAVQQAPAPQAPAPSAPQPVTPPQAVTNATTSPADDGNPWATSPPPPPAFG
jgi:predicted component of type VI protein secretion system